MDGPIVRIEKFCFESPSIGNWIGSSCLMSCEKLDKIKVDKTLRFVEEPVEIMDREVKSLKRCKIALVKVLWNSKCGPDFTWEREDYMKSKYPQLFADRADTPKYKFQLIQECKLQEVKAADASLRDTNNSGSVSDNGNAHSSENNFSKTGNYQSSEKQSSTSGNDSCSKQPEFINDTSLMEKVDSNTTPDLSDMCNNEFEDDQNADDHEDERVVLANLIANLKLDIDENKTVQKQLRKLNATLTHEPNECKSALAKSNDIRDRCRSALHHHEIKLEKYKSYKDCTNEKDKVELVDLAWEKRMDNAWQQLTIQEIIMLVINLLISLAIKLKDDAFEFENALKKEMFEDLEYVQSLEKENQALQSGQHCLVLQDVDEIETINIELEHSVAKLLYENENLHKENEHLKQTYKDLYDSIKLTRDQTKVKNYSLIEQLNKKSVENAYLKAQLQDKTIANTEMRESWNKIKGKGVDTNFGKPLILGKPPLQPIKNQLVVRQSTTFKSKRSSFSKIGLPPKLLRNMISQKPLTPHSWPQVRQYDFAKLDHVNALVPSRNSSKGVSFLSPKESVGSNDMVHNYYLEEAKKKAQIQVDKALNTKPSVQ
ncbi:hypothetical protein Tco_1211596 [Tanacetum coccineum]